MFEVGSYIIYGSSGVCKVEDIGTMDVPGIPKERLYYTLSPVYSKANKIFIPIDNKKVVMRPVISKDGAEELIKSIKDIESLWIADDRKRDEVFKQELLKCESKAWVKIIKTLYLRKMNGLSEGKKMTASDKKYLQIAEENLYGELAIPLNIEKKNVEEYIISKVELLDE